MKKIVSLILVICILSASCVLFSSCADRTLSEKVLKENPVKQLEVLADGADKALTDFFDVAGVGKTLGNMEKGSLQIIVDNEMLSNYYGIGKIDETLYFDYSDKQFNALVSDTEVEYNGQTLEGSLYLDKNALYLASEDLLGSSNAYKVTLSDLIENFEGSVLEEELGRDSEEVKAALQSIEQAFSMLSSSADTSSYKELLKYAPNLIKQFLPAITSEQINGTAAFTVTYTLNNETIANFLNACLEDLPEKLLESFAETLSEMAGETLDADDLKKVAEDGVKELIEQMNRSVAIDMTVAYAIAKESNALVSATVKGSLAPKTIESDSQIDFEAAMLLSPEEISLTASIGYTAEYYGEEMAMEYSASAKLTKETTQEQVRIIGEVDAAYTQKTGFYNDRKEFDDLVTLSVTHEKDGDFEVKAKINSESIEQSPITLTANGELSTDDGKVTFALDSIGASGVALTDLGVTLVMTPDAKAPSVPQNATELITMTEDDWMALVDAVQNSKLGKIIWSQEQE